MPIVKNISDTQKRTDLPEIKPGFTIRVHQKIKEGEKERIQMFEGVVIACKGGKGTNATFTVRKISNGVGVERIYPLHSPNVAKVEIVKENDVKHAKLYYVRGRQDSQPRVGKARAQAAKKAKQEATAAKKNS